MSSRTTLKTYFLTGASPTEAQFADLIDSVLVLEEDLVDNFSSTSTTDALTANAGKILNDSLTDIDARVQVLENASSDYLSNYYTKSEIDASITNLGISIDTKVSTSTFNTLNTEVSGIQTSLGGKADSSHAHVAADITDLGDLLGAKASTTYVDNTKDYLEGLIGAIDPGVDLSHLDDYADLSNKVANIETSLSGYATTAQLASKAEVGHNHTLSDLTDLDITDFYNKASVDALLADIEPGEHTHVESDITDLDKYTKAQTDQEILDHSGLTNNPHGVTKAQVGLGDVENLTVSGIFSHADAPDIPTQAEFDALNLALTTHSGLTNNPHSVTKAQVGLDQVPNIDVNALLVAHLAADNPHEIDASFLDVYTKAEVQTKIEENYDAHRYAFKPLNPTDGGGAIGDFAYHDTGLYFKFGAAEWRQILSSKVFNDGSPGSKFQIETPKLEVVTKNGDNLFTVDGSGSPSSTEINTTNLFVTGGGTTNLFEVNNEGSTSITEINTTNVSIAGTTNIANNLNVTSTQVSIHSGLAVTGNVSIGNNLSLTSNDILTTLGNLRLATLEAGKHVQVDDDLEVTGNLKVKGGGSTDLFQVTSSQTSLTTPLNVSSNVSLGSNLDITSKLDVGGDVSIAGNLSAKVNSLVLRGGTGAASVVEVDDDLNVTGSTSTVGLTSTSGGTFTGAGVTIGTASANQPLTVNGTLTAGAINASSLNPNNTVKAQSGDLILEGKDGNKVQVNDALDVVGATTIGTSSANQNLTVNGNITASGNLTINGTTTTIDTTNLLIEDNIVVLNKNQTGTPATTLKSGIEVERGDTANTKIYFDEASDKWKVDVAGTIKTIAFTEDLYSN
jgi:hypothetical protein